MSHLFSEPLDAPWRGYFNWENDDKQFFTNLSDQLSLGFCFRSTPCALPGQGLERSWGLRDFILPHKLVCTKMLDTLNIPMLKRMRRYWILAPLSCCIAQGGRLAGHAENAAMHLRSPRAEQKTELGVFGSIWQFQYSFHQMISEVDLLNRQVWHLLNLGLSLDIRRMAAGQWHHERRRGRGSLYGSIFFNKALLCVGPWFFICQAPPKRHQKRHDFYQLITMVLHWLPDGHGSHGIHTSQSPSFLGPSAPRTTVCVCDVVTL